MISLEAGKLPCSTVYFREKWKLRMSGRRCKAGKNSYWQFLMSERKAKPHLTQVRILLGTFGCSRSQDASYQLTRRIFKSMWLECGGGEDLTLMAGIQ